jgi:Tfp pilus assembly protein PilW
VKTISHNQSIPRRAAAFTLAEVMVASSIFVMLMSSLIYTFLFGLHLQETTATKLGASDNARKALIHLTDEIRSATTITIGSGDPTSFIAVGTKAEQFRNSMQL